MEIEFCNLKRQYNYLKSRIDRNIAGVLAHGKFLNGPEIVELEDNLASFTGAKYGIAVSSGTDGLLAALMACGVKSGDYVITPPFTFISTAETIAILGARPLFVDIDSKTFNLDPEELAKFLENPTEPMTDGKVPVEKIKCVLPVDLFGQCADYDKIKEIVEKFHPFIIEDGAQALGAEYGERKGCSLGDVSVASFFPSKPLGAYGDGGMVFTDDEILAEKLKMLRNHGQSERYNHKILGLNLRMDTIQAAVLLAKFEVLDEELAKRRKVAGSYRKGLLDLSNREKLILPYIEEFNKSIYAQFSILVNERDKLKDFLKERGIPTAVHYPKPLHLQEAFSYLGYKEGDFPVAEEVAKKIISLPICAYKTEEEISYITKEIGSFFNGIR